MLLRLLRGGTITGMLAVDTALVNSGQETQFSGTPPRLVKLFQAIQPVGALPPQTGLTKQNVNNSLNALTRNQGEQSDLNDIKNNILKSTKTSTLTENEANELVGKIDTVRRKDNLSARVHENYLKSKIKEEIDKLKRS